LNLDLLLDLVFFFVDSSIIEIYTE